MSLFERSTSDRTYKNKSNPRSDENENTEMGSLTICPSQVDDSQTLPSLQDDPGVLLEPPHPMEGSARDDRIPSDIPASTFELVGRRMMASTPTDKQPIWQIPLRFAMLLVTPAYLGLAVLGWTTQTNNVVVEQCKEETIYPSTPQSETAEGSSDLQDLWLFCGCLAVAVSFLVFFMFRQFRTSQFEAGDVEVEIPNRHWEASRFTQGSRTDRVWISFSGKFGAPPLVAASLIAVDMGRQDGQRGRNYNPFVVPVFSPYVTPSLAAACVLANHLGRQAGRSKRSDRPPIRVLVTRVTTEGFEIGVVSGDDAVVEAAMIHWTAVRHASNAYVKLGASRGAEESTQDTGARQPANNTEEDGPDDGVNAHTSFSIFDYIPRFRSAGTDNP